MEDVEIPDERVLVRGEDAFGDLLEALNWERLGTVAFTNAMASCALDKALEYAETREQFGQPIGEFQGIEWKLADMAKQLEVSRALAHRSATTAMEQDAHPDPYETSVAKLFSAEMVERVVSEAVQVHGANGYMQEMPLGYLYRLARGRRIGAGTDEVMKNTIARMLKRDGVPGLLD
jgi:alkylation response protein AidB-like acyl-CoA dehydrogenase